MWYEKCKTRHGNLANSFLLTSASAHVIVGGRQPHGEPDIKLRKVLLVSVVAGSFLTGCASYYRVSQPGSSKVYYTDKVDRKDSGVVVFKDAATQMEVTLPSSQIEQITKEQYDTGKAQELAAPPSHP